MKDESKMERLRGFKADSEGSGFFGGQGFENGAHGKLCLLQSEEPHFLSTTEMGKARESSRT